MSEESSRGRGSGLQRFLGDRPLSVLVRLTLMSLLVGFLMAFFGFEVADFWRWIERLVRDFSRDGLKLLRDSMGYILTGAAIVVPVWLLMRLGKAGRRG